MCGIAGFIDVNKKSNEEILKRMTDTMVHRGPDGSDYFVQDGNNFQLGLGHRRLSIIELTELGKQPMHYKDLVVVFNGEIYNFKEVKAELSQLGHRFIAESDTEMILHAYEEWGVNCLQKFIGMFAIVLFDMAKNEVFIARDRAGIKPLFLYQKDGLLLFASELKAFHKHPNFQKHLSVPAVHAFLQYGSVPTPHCIFENCLKVKPGHYIHSTISNEGIDLKEIQYWNVYDAYNKPKLDLGIEEAKDMTEKLLKSACDYRMVADVPVGVFLSGGYDSTAVTALLQKDRTEKLKTYTISVPDIGLNEAPHAKRTAEILGTDHSETECSAREAIDLIANLPFHYDEPFADSSAIPTTLVSKIARQDVTVALSADAGDEIFAGYNRYEMILKYGLKMKKIPGFVRKGMAGAMDFIPANSIPYMKRKYNFAQRYEKTKSILRDNSSKNLMLSLSQLFTTEQLRKLCLHDYTELSTYFDSTELKNPTPLSFAMAMDYQTYLLDDILQKVDRASMTVSLESRELFLDHRIIDFVAQLPDDYKYRNGEKKWLLKEIVHQYVPKSEMDRPKMGFAIPIENWLRNELREQMEYYLSPEKINETGLFSPYYIEYLKCSFIDGRQEYGVKIWYLLSFMMWYEKWMKGS